MFKRVWFIALLMLATFSVLPVAAQDGPIQAADYVPANFAGFIQINLENRRETLQGLNIASTVASLVQPTRVVLGNNTLGFDDFIPLNSWFTADNTTFTGNILPWLKGNFAIAYKNFNGQLQTDPADILLILPTASVLDAAGSLSNVIKQKDTFTRQSYRGIEVYEGQQISLAFTSPVIFIGPTDLVHAALDVQAGAAPSMISAPVYGALRASTDDQSFAFAYIDGDHILPAISGLVGGQKDSEALITAFGAALAKIRNDNSFETLLLNHGFDGAAASLDFTIEQAQAIFTAKAVFHSGLVSEQVQQPADFDSALLNMIPRNALLVQTGTDASALVKDVMTALPMSNFARQMVGGMPIRTLGTDSELVTIPTAEHLAAAVNNYVNVLAQSGGFNLQKDFLDHLSGSYMVALLPRPNNPLPSLNVPFDLVMAVHVNDAAALDGASHLLQNLFALKPLENQTLEDWDFSRLGAGSNVVFNLGVKDGTLIIATGDVIQSALGARRGDNRLIDQPPWQTLSKTARPDLYLDNSAFANTFFPATGGQVPTGDNRVQFGLHTTYLGNNIHQLTFSAVIPTGNSSP